MRCHKNVKNSLNHLQQLNLIIVVQNIEIESLWNLEQLCKICIESNSKQTTLTAEIHCVSYPLFDKAMKDCNINITIFLPKKEQCDKCLSAKEGHIIRVYLFFIETNKLKLREMLFPFNVNNYYAMFSSLDLLISV